MKIKNIKEYRKFYKNEVRDQPTRDENFIGNFRMEDGKKRFGWFDIYHGDKEGYGKAENGIENFLQSFLDMARDGQAVYEFLQNAVDAGSSHYTMVWGRDEIDGNHYLMVVNNGDMFSLNSVRSILNVGSSTKSADSKTIGKFGIGFKLAHRLVGKDNGLEELLHENSGPLLFSWQNYDLAELAAGTMPEPTPMQISSIGENLYRSDDPAPWLFKILITCFPNLPENDSVSDLPTMANGVLSPAPPFSSEEYQTLSRWVRKHSHTLNHDTYESGALFFIKLGEGKENELAEGNLREGVKFALAILNQTAEENQRSKNVLRTVQLNEKEPITLPELEYLKIGIDKKQQADTYAFIRFGVESFAELSQEQLNKADQESDIEVLFGFRPYDQIDKVFKGAPNFYLYFPLSEEVHNFNYILHSNAFYKGSSRTFLHKGSGKEDGINERLLKVIVDKIEEQFETLSSSNDAADRRKFLDFYAALLSSGQSANNERKWIDEPYVNRITKLLKRFIPCRLDEHSEDFIISDDPSSVYIKGTNVDIDIQGWGLTSVSWFYWGEGGDLQLKHQALIKLDIKRYGIQNLLKSQATIVNQLNDWIGADAEKMDVIMKEVTIDSSLLDAGQRTNLFGLNLLLFQDYEVHSIESFKEIETTGYLVTRNKLTDIRDVLSKLSLRHSINDVEEFTRAFNSYFGNQSQLMNYDVLTRVFSTAVQDELLKTLSDEEKLRVYNAFRTLNESPGTRMPLLKIFANKKGAYYPIGNLLEATPKAWLAPYQIEKDFGAITKTYLIKEDAAIFEAIINPFWKAIATHLATDPKMASVVLKEITSYYAQSEWTEKSKNLITGITGIFFKGNFVESENIFFDNRLSGLSTKNYSNIQEVLFQLFDMVMPDQFFLPYLQADPFDFDSIDFSFEIPAGEINGEDLNSLLLVDDQIDGDFFEHHAIGTESGRFVIYKDQTQIYTSNKKLLKYIKTYHAEQYQPLPEEFSHFKDRAKLTHLPLLHHIIEVFQEEDMKQELELIELVFEEGLQDQLNVFHQLTYINLDASWKALAQNTTCLKFVSNLLGVVNDDFDLSEIHTKLRILGRNGDVIIGDVHHAEDTILIPFRERQLHISQSQLLDFDDKEGISLIGEFASSAVQQGLISANVAEQLFKQNSTVLSEELLERFKEITSDGQIKNAHQLLYLLFSGHFQSSEVENYQVQMQSEELFGIKGNLVLHNVRNDGFIDKNYVLNENFKDLQSILGTADLEIVPYGNDTEDIFLSQFLFLSGVDPSILAHGVEQMEMVNYLFSSWLMLGSQFRMPLPYEKWNNVLGFDPLQTVIGRLVLKDEKLPQQIFDWIGENRNKILFLDTLGVSTDKSQIIKLREWLCGVNSAELFNKEASAYSPKLLFNTIIGLATDFSEVLGKAITFENDGPQLRFVEEIYSVYLEHEDPPFIPNLVYVAENVFRIGQDDDLEVVCVDQELLDLLFLDPYNHLEILFSQTLVVKASIAELYTYETLKLGKQFIIPDIAIEHDEPFYTGWKDIYHIRLFKADELKFDVFYNEQSIGHINKGEWYIDESRKDFIDIYYFRSLSLESLAEKLDDKSLSDPLGVMISDKDNMLRNLYNVMNAVGKDEISDANFNALRIAMLQENLICQRAGYADTMESETKYSSEWFITFLNYLATFESQQNNIQQKTIVFQEISNYAINDLISDKFFMLNAANSIIPVNIEEFMGFALEITFKDRSQQKITVEGVSKKGQDLLIYCPQPLSAEVQQRFMEILNLKISFTPKLDLIKELKKAFENVNNIEEWEDIVYILKSFFKLFD